jgi:hypothetical protein
MPTQIGDAYVDAGGPDHNFGQSTKLHMRVTGYEDERRSYIKIPDPTKRTFHFYVFDTWPKYTGGCFWTLAAWTLDDYFWEENTITWNNKPSEIAKIATVTVTNVPGWYSITIPGDITSFTLMWLDGVFDEEEVSEVIAYSYQAASQYRPYYT